MLLMILNVIWYSKLYIKLDTLNKIFDVLLFIKIDHENQNKKYDNFFFSILSLLLQLKRF
jgi:hypothetical protein